MNTCPICRVQLEDAAMVIHLVTRHPEDVKKGRHIQHGLSASVAQEASARLVWPVEVGNKDEGLDT